MQLCSCGVAHDDSLHTCPITLAHPPMQESLTETCLNQRTSDRDSIESRDQMEAPAGRRTSTLINFPGVTRTMPEWRKQLSQRVREVQERRAREAAEAAASEQAAETVSCALPSAQLELVPDREQPVMNPIVSKALERVERARRTDFAAPFTPTAAAPARDPTSEVLSEASEPAQKIEVKRKLVAVPVDNGETVEKPRFEERRKPVRLITGAADDAALSYLENYLSIPAVGIDTKTDSAGLVHRIVSGFVDLLVIGSMAAPFAAAIEFADGNWSDPRLVGLMAGVVIVLMFVYLTAFTALTGRTLGMRLLSLRTIDVRTGLIPTGGQSIKRAVGYILSLVFLGLGLVLALIDSEGRTFHDRFSETLVVHN